MSKAHLVGSLATADPRKTRLGASYENGTAAETTSEDVDTLRAIVEGTACSTGEEFFRGLVRHLASALAMPFAVISEFTGGNRRVHTLAFWARDRIVDNLEYELPGTPCEDVVHGQLCHHPVGVKERFPRAKPLVQLAVESYLGAPLVDGQGHVLGLLAVFDEQPMPAEPRHLFILRIFAARATAELLRLRAEQHLSSSERRYRDLYEEAPVGYLSISVDGRIQSANHRAEQMIGLTTDQLEGRLVVHLFAKPARDAAAFQRFSEGEQLAGLEVEMRRQDGQPLWVSMWMKPILGPDGAVRAQRLIWVDITDRVLAEVERARLQQQNLYLQDEIRANHNFEELIGQSAALRAVLDKVGSVAATDASVLITGETGTGKELIARAVHSASKRRDRPLIKVNCAAFPAGLIESELFGHEKGAFTGAVSRRCGRFELANGGTIFLDEVGDIPLETQAKLLRVLQERECERIGSNSPMPLDIRILAATNRDLLQAIKDKQFREDLYYRLNVFPIHVPPLRQRKDDIPLLAHFLINKLAARIGKPVPALPEPALRRLLDYRWPGNVREMENVLERAVILARGGTLNVLLELLPPSVPAPSAAERVTLEAVERAYIGRILQQTEGVIEGPRGAARILGLHANTLRNRMKKLGIARGRFAKG
jgi:formate hydrogenlyase transcriptional activator